MGKFKIFLEQALPANFVSGSRKIQDKLKGKNLTKEEFIELVNKVASKLGITDIKNFTKYVTNKINFKG